MVRNKSNNLRPSNSTADGDRSVSPLRSLIQRFKKPPRKDTDEASNTTPKPRKETDESSNTAPKPQPKPQQNPAISSKFGNAWLKAEEQLKEERGKRALLEKYDEILGLELGIDLKSLEPTDHHKQLVQLLEKKVQELESKKITVLLGCTPGFEERLKDIFQNVLTAKDLISAAASASPPASIACAGVTVILTVS